MGEIMLQETITLYKLIVLYMLNRVNFSLTAAQVSDFLLEKDYTDFMTLQQVFGELREAGMITSETIRNRTHLSITAEGRETLHFFQDRISEPIRQDIDSFFQENEISLRDEVSIQGNYYKSVSGEYEAHLIAQDNGVKLVELILSVPTTEIADAICDNWQKKNQEIYQYLTQQLF